MDALRPAQPTAEEIEQAYAATLQRAEGHPRVQRAMDEWREQALAAIAEGATWIRVGSAIFGPRLPKA